MLPALFLVPLVALFRILLAWLPSTGSTWLPGNSPVAAVALCAGLFLTPRRLALLVPLAILLLSDLVIDLHYGASFFTGHLLVRYAVLALIGAAGLGMRGRSSTKGLWPVLGATVLGSLFFYATTNSATWAGSPDYPQTASGLWQALTVGLPGYPPTYLFFRNELVSDLLYSMVFVACVRWAGPARSREAIRNLPAAGARESDGLLIGAHRRG